MLAYIGFSQSILGPLMPFLRTELQLNYTRWSRRAVFWFGSLGLATGVIPLTLVDIVAENKIYKAGARAVTSTVDACPGRTWRLPCNGSRGVQLRDDGIDLFGNAKEASTPVYAMADGVAILHEDSLRPGKRYGHSMAA